MMEQDWLTSTTPRPLLEFVGGKMSPRKLRLFAVACCRRLDELFTEESRQALEPESKDKEKRRPRAQAAAGTAVDQLTTASWATSSAARCWRGMPAAGTRRTCARGRTLDRTGAAGHNGTPEEAPMTEKKWLACKDPSQMLEFLRGKASDRKLRLFAVACCRRVWHILADNRGRKAVLVSEKFADGMASKRQLANARRGAEQAWNEFNDAQPEAYETSRDAGEAGACHITAIGGAERAADTDAMISAFRSTAPAADAVGYEAARSGAPASYKNSKVYGRLREEAQVTEYANQCDLIRCIFHPFRPVTVDPRWTTGAVARLAEAIYDDRAFDRLPILADALEDAGCTDPDILAHCRGGGEHCRGCWVVDMLTGKE